MLNAEVRGAVEKGDFHVYAMSHIDDALGLLTDMPVGEEREDGTFPEGSINARVMKSLEKMNEKDSDHHH